MGRLLAGMLPVSFYINNVIDDIHCSRQQTEQSETSGGMQECRDIHKLAVEDKRREQEAVLQPLFWAHRGYYQHQPVQNHAVMIA
jgi:hypothetical protein